jgi:RNA-binding protein
MLNSKQRAYLRSLANGIDTIYQIGKGGVTPEITAGISDALEARELVKARILETAPETVRETAETIAGRTQSEVVTVIGSRFVLYRRAKDPKNRKIVLP